ncbi:MAG: hypothetical protein WC172_04890, partial [Candidatus Izemoplasmatales bacterium]
MESNAELSDPGMAVKMNYKCFPSIKNLAEGKRANEDEILDLVAFVNARHDCADFRVLSCLKAMYEYPDLISLSTKKAIKSALLGFKYWLDEPGIDGMCFWSENHQIIFHTAEYLAGHLFPDDSFSNDNITGLQHQEKARPKILRWLGQRFQYGFIEWHSNTYYEEDIAALAMLIDYAPEMNIRIQATMIMDLLMLDMAMHQFEGYFVATSGRCYEKQKKDPRNADVNDILKCAFGILDHEYDYSRISTLVLLCKHYVLPPVIRKIALAKGTFVIKESMGMDVKEATKKIFPADFDHLGMYLWQMEAFTNPESIEMTMAIFNEWKLTHNNFLKDLKMINRPFLLKSGCLPFLVSVLNPATAGVAIQRANTYTYRTPHYLLSSVQHYHPGKFGDQQHIWQVTLPGGINLFSTHPGRPMFQDPARNFSPSYWVGNGINPECTQEKNIVLLIYDLTKRRGFLEQKRLNLVHFYCPFDQMDEVSISGRLVVVRKQNTYVAIMSDKEAEKKEDEILYRGRILRFAIILGDQEHDGSFADFCQSQTLKRFKATGKKVSYAGEKRLTLRYNNGFFIDKQRISTDYPRYDTPFISADREPSQLEIHYEKDVLTHYFSRFERKRG